MSTSGTLVGFESAADDPALENKYVGGATNGKRDVYVRDLKSGKMQIISHTPGGVVPNDHSYGAAVSGDGTHVAFTSDATNLLSPQDIDGNWAADVFVRNRATGSLERISVGQKGEADKMSYAPALSPTGKVVAFESTATNLVQGYDVAKASRNIYVRDRTKPKGVVELISSGQAGQGNGHSEAPSISGTDVVTGMEGRYVAFSSWSTNLINGEAPGVVNIYVKDRKGGIERVSRGPNAELPNGNSHMPQISADGSKVAFWSEATNLVPGVDVGGSWPDVYIYDRTAKKTERVSVTTAEVQPEPGKGGGWAKKPAISADGNYVAFWASGKLVAEDTNGNWDMYLRNRKYGTTVRTSVATGCKETSGDSEADIDVPAVSDWGYVAYASKAATLVKGDTNGMPDVFHYKRTLACDPGPAPCYWYFIEPLPWPHW